MGIERRAVAPDNSLNSFELTESDSDDPTNPVADASTIYNTENGSGGDREPVFSEELGVAIESLRPGASIAQLWSIADKIDSVCSDSIMRRKLFDMLELIRGFYKFRCDAHFVSCKSKIPGAKSGK